MFQLDEDIYRTYVMIEEFQRQRLWLERLLHPELFKWAKQGEPPPMTDTKKIRLSVLEGIGLNEKRYQSLKELEQGAKDELGILAMTHPLSEHSKRIGIFGKGTYLIGAFIAAGGNIQRTPTCSSFWKGMGLDVLSDGSVPRKIRGNKDVERRLPCLPHVSRVGEQIRMQINRSKGTKMRALYEHWRAFYDEKYPDRPKMFNFKAGLRIAQKLLYSCLWEEWRKAYDLPAPEPYPFSILGHDPSQRIRIADLYDR